MKNNEDILKRILLNMKYDPKKTLNENKLNIISENSNKCRHDYWWKMEKADPNNKSLPICWNGVDPLSCDLRKTLSNYKLHTAFCSDIGNVRCGWIKYKNQCAFGAQGGDFKNTFIPDTSMLRNESIVISPITNNESNLRVTVFIERKKLIENLKKLLGKGFTSPYVDLPSSKGLLYTSPYDDSKSTVFWEIEVASDQLIQSVLGLLKNNTSIPFEESSQGSKWLYINDVPKTPTVRDQISKGGFDFQKVKDEFGSSGSLADNTKLLDAWNSGWRPGEEVPEKYQTEKYVLSKNKGTGSPNNPYNPDEEFTIVNNGESEGDSSLGITLYMSGSGGN